ncbi:hypothetical protein KC845_00950 [Candidatus Kaiserbacteria bacterium]|nr:hypothetical protein [Candidatus Kaiserbacteria bacterium]
MGESIQDKFNKFKALLVEDSLFYSGLILLIGATSFGLGRLSVVDSSHIVGPVVDIEQSAMVTVSPPTAKAEVTDPINPVSSEPVSEKAYVGSKNGSKYHLLSCPGAKQIKEENKVYFSSIAEAESKGYTPAGNCKGL